ncbi:MAG: hypothetical protein ACK5P7_13340 [Bdellovibrio sp.]
MRARFFRIYHVPVVIQDKVERADVRVCLESGVDPLSGMTLNLTQVDSAASQYQIQIKDQSFESGRHFFREMLNFWQRELSQTGAQLAELTLAGLSSPQGWFWQQGLVDPLVKTRVWTQVRFQQELRQGWTDYLIPEAAMRETSLPISQISVTVAGEKEIAAQLAHQCPAAIRASFRDDATGESWGYKK